MRLFVDGGVVPDGEDATFVLDAHSGSLLSANPAGLRLWGIGGALALPLALDQAMPALQRLREIAAGGDEAILPTDESLTFWTARGLLVLACRIERPDARVATFMLHAKAAPAASASQAGPAGAKTAHDVALPARLAHELRTPLSAVIAYAEILKSEHFGPLANPRYQGYVRDIYDSAQHALSVVDGMLQGAADRAALPAQAFRDVDPGNVIESCLAVARPLADRAGLAVGAHYAPQLPRIIADEVSLKQMLLNLLANAIKFSRRGDRIDVSVAWDAGGPLAIAIADTGPGMPPPTGEAGAARHPNTGLGLGLPLTRSLAEANGASLTIQSAPGSGTRATITFGKERIVPV